VQFALPGMPTIYYGDEVGMTGLLDPFNRKPFAAEDAEFEAVYRRLAGLRRAHPVFAKGPVIFFATNGNVFGVMRHTVHGRDAFGEPAKPEAILTLVNPTSVRHTIAIDLMTEKECEPRECLDALRAVEWKCAVSLLTGQESAMRAGLLELAIEPFGMEICELIWE
jgi:glycosidase